MSEENFFEATGEVEIMFIDAKSGSTESFTFKTISHNGIMINADKLLSELLNRVNVAKAAKIVKIAKESHMEKYELFKEKGIEELRKDPSVTEEIHNISNLDSHNRSDDKNRTKKILDSISGLIDIGIKKQEREIIKLVDDIVDKVGPNFFTDLLRLTEKIDIEKCDKKKAGFDIDIVRVLPFLKLGVMQFINTYQEYLSSSDSE